MMHTLSGTAIFPVLQAMSTCIQTFMPWILRTPHTFLASTSMSDVEEFSHTSSVRYFVFRSLPVYKSPLYRAVKHLLSGHNWHGLGFTREKILYNDYRAL
ncbi:hypothetical protein [Candidatus Nitrosotenuis uzonensis]|uniref:hypothetical protein n=1 Tax=Candidatus Nitrosotenuis uzonensis TaxID=1407055 RepID=UPI0015A726AB|nr:hypothetical protein [Candidatus Nitrosotenuis uzonensis]